MTTVFKLKLRPIVVGIVTKLDEIGEIIRQGVLYERTISDNINLLDSVEIEAYYNFGRIISDSMNLSDNVIANSILLVDVFLDDSITVADIAEIESQYSRDSDYDSVIISDSIGIAVIRVNAVSVNDSVELNDNCVVTVTTSGITVLDKDGNSFDVALNVLNSSGSSFTVTNKVLNSSGTEFTVS